eukprot:Colp12_sorted_trinity150504_noHs@9995
MAEKRAGGDDLDDDFYVYEPITDEVDDDDEHVEKKASTPKVTPKAKETKKRKAENLAEYIKTIEPEWSTVFGAEKKKKKGKESAKGSPVLLIITSAGIRSADVFRALGDFNKECRVGKLFAKHMKVPEQVAFLKGTHIKIAVGTPNRLCKLIEEGALKLDRLKYVLVDATYRDVKNRSLFQMTELVSDLLTLYKTHCLNRIKEGHTKMLMF